MTLDKVLNVVDFDHPKKFFIKVNKVNLFFAKYFATSIKSWEEPYLETLGQLLDPQVQIFWTGPEICSTRYPLEHLQEVSQKLGRKPFIWDNYPVNDSARMCNHLHLHAFEDRPHQMATISGHAVNPMHQAYLSQIPLQTLHLSYQQQEQYCPQQALLEAAEFSCGPDLAKMLLDDLSLLQNQGLQQLSSDNGSPSRVRMHCSGEQTSK